MCSLLDLIDELDLSQALILAWSKDPRGENGFDPRISVKPSAEWLTMLRISAYCVGIVSSCKLERACYENLRFHVRTGTQQPVNSRISELRRRNFDALNGLLV